MRRLPHFRNATEYNRTLLRGSSKLCCNKTLAQYFKSRGQSSFAIKEPSWITIPVNWLFEQNLSYLMTPLDKYFNGPSNLNEIQHFDLY